MIRFVASDIDGTLLDSQWKLPEANRLAVEEAVAHGIEVALVTGRRFDFARPIAELFHCPLTLIVNNGGLVKTPDGTTRLRHLLPTDVALKVLDVTRAFRDGAAVVFDRPTTNQVIFEKIDWDHPGRRSYFERNRAYLAAVEPLEDSLVEDPIQVMFSGPVAQMRELMAVLRAQPFASEFSLAATEYESRDLSLVDVIARGCSKGATLAEWVTLQGLTSDDVLALGDNLNDLEMLTFAGHPVVMGNAVPELRGFGWPTTLSCDEAGAGVAIRKYALDHGKTTEGTELTESRG